MYDGKQYDSYSFQDADTVKVDTWERDYYDPDFTSFVSSETISLEEGIKRWTAAKDDGYELYNQYYKFRDRFGEEHAARFEALANAAGTGIDHSFQDMKSFLNWWRGRLGTE